MAWAQNLLGFCLFACASQTPFSWVWPGGLQASKSYVAHARPKHLFLEFGLVACRLPSLTLRKGLPCLRQPFFFVFSRFQKQRFGIFRRFQKQRFGSFLAAVSHGLGTSFFLMGSKSDVSAFFRLRFRNGLGTKPAGVLPFRMRVPNTFFLSLAWWLAGFQVLRCAKVCLAWGNRFSLFLVGSKSNVSAFFRFGIFPAAVSQWLGHKTCWGSAFSPARPKHLFLEFGLVACRLFLCF